MTNKADKALQAKLRKMIAAESLTDVSERFAIGREALARYLADIPMHTSTFRGIEATVASAVWPRASEAERGL